MTQIGLTLRLMRRNPVRHLAWLLLPFTFLLFLASGPKSALWTALLIAPVFLIASAVTVPAFSPFELSLPIARSQLLWARILMCLALLWLTVLPGAAILYPLPHVSRPSPRQPLEFAAFFTACACLATFARISPRRPVERICWLLALLSGALALRALPLWPALVLASLAGAPFLAKLWWTYIPEWHWQSARSLRGSIWPPLRFLWNWWTLILIPLFCLFGLEQSWVSLLMCCFFFMTTGAVDPIVRALPISRRHLLWALLAPTAIPFLIGIAFSNLYIPQRTIADFRHQAGDSGYRSYDGNPPGLIVPQYLFRESPVLPIPPVVSPWGESATPLPSLVGRFTAIYDPYWVWTSNSNRFFEWQFARATRDIYGKPLLPKDLPAALADGLVPLTRQPRMVILKIAFGAALLLFIALLPVMSNWHRLRRIPRPLLLLTPLLLPVAAIGSITFLAPFSPDVYADRFLLHLSAILPSNLAFTIPILIVALAPLYWAVEAVFNQAEFPDKPKENA
jgi:hypothetical protein